MNDKQKHPMVKANRGFFQDIAFQIKLVWRLLTDPRISPFLKILPIGSLIYFIFPDIAPGPIDDALVIGAGTYLFVELCPSEIVNEHKKALENETTGIWHDPNPQDHTDINEEDIIEGKYREK